MAPSRCCSPGAYGEFFDEKLARRDADRYRRKRSGARANGLSTSSPAAGSKARRCSRSEAARGRSRSSCSSEGLAATNVELSPGYETEARRLLEERGLSERAERHVVDLATDRDAVGDADVVLLHRVVCCYPDYESLLSVAAGEVRRLVAFSFPPDLAVSRPVRVLNLGPRLRGCDFRSYIHSERAMLTAVERQDFRLAGRAERAGVRRLALLERG